MPAQTPRSSLSPLREADPVFFSHAEQRPSAATSDMVSFRGSEVEILDDSMSLAASDREELSGSIDDPALPQSDKSSEPKQAATPNFSVSYQELWTSWARSGLRRKSPPQSPG